MKFLAALQFLTSIPLPGRHPIKPEALGRSAGYFPIVGLIIGLIMAGLNWLLNLVLPVAVVNALLLVYLAVITGALHLDGFIDTCDGIAGHKPAEARWQVMHDSRAGAFGIVGAVLLMLVKYVALSSLPGYLVVSTLVFMPVVSRWAMVFALFAYPYARPSGLGAVFKQGTRWGVFVAATLVTFVIALVLLPLFRLEGLLTMLGVGVVTVAVAGYLNSKFAGLTGDSYGAINEVAEVSVLLMVILLARFGLA